jgi:hypothetical protein
MGGKNHADEAQPELRLLARSCPSEGHAKASALPPTADLRAVTFALLPIWSA